MKKSYFFYVEKVLVGKNVISKVPHNNCENNVVPSKQIIQNLINYSKSLDIINLKTLGKVGILYN
jgi:hypothetical protein